MGWFIRRIEYLDEDAAYAIDEKAFMELMLVDVFRYESEDVLYNRYRDMLDQYRDFDIDLHEFLKVIHVCVHRIQDHLIAHRVPLGRNLKFKWKHRSFNLYIYGD